MSKKVSHKNAFTLIEVMVAVMIISVVIMALLQMYANNTHMFTSLKKQTEINQYSSFLISNDDYGFENKNIYLYDLVSDFDMENNLRRELKETKAKSIYKELETIDMSESSSSLGLEIGKSILQIDEGSTALLRFRVR